MLSAATLRLDYSAGPAAFDPYANPQGTPGLSALLPFGFNLENNDQVFIRNLRPANAEFAYGGTLSGDNAFAFYGFPGFSNDFTSDPIVDNDGVPLQFAKLRLLAFFIQPLNPWAAAPATGVLISNNTNVSNNDTVTIGGVTYTFKISVGSTAGNVHIGADADASLANLAAAVNYTGAPGTDYVGTVENPDVSAEVLTGHTLRLTARVPGIAGNDLPLTTSITTAVLVAADSTLYPQPVATLTFGAEIAEPRTARPFGGTVNITTTGNLTPDAAASTGSSANFSTEEAAAFIFARPTAWIPGSGAAMTIWFDATTGPHAAVNASVTVLLIGSKA